MPIKYRVKKLNRFIPLLIIVCTSIGFFDPGTVFALARRKQERVVEVAKAADLAKPFSDLYQGRHFYHDYVNSEALNYGKKKLRAAVSDFQKALIHSSSPEFYLDFFNAFMSEVKYACPKEFFCDSILQEIKKLSTHFGLVKAEKEYLAQHVSVLINIRNEEWDWKKDALEWGQRNYQSTRSPLYQPSNFQSSNFGLKREEMSFLKDSVNDRINRIKEKYENFAVISTDREWGTLKRLRQRFDPYLHRMKDEEFIDLLAHFLGSISPKVENWASEPLIVETLELFQTYSEKFSFHSKEVEALEWTLRVRGFGREKPYGGSLLRKDRWGHSEAIDRASWVEKKDAEILNQYLERTPDQALNSADRVMMTRSQFKELISKKIDSAASIPVQMYILKLDQKEIFIESLVSKIFPKDVDSIRYLPIQLDHFIRSEVSEPVYQLILKTLSSDQKQNPFNRIRPPPKSAKDFASRMGDDDAANWLKKLNEPRTLNIPLMQCEPLLKEFKTGFFLN